jgi:hypothetical protein
MEFVYTRSNQSNIKVDSCRLLYDRRYMSSIGWFKIVESEPVGLKLIKISIHEVELT